METSQNYISERVKNSTWYINPATEEKQDDIVTAIENIPTTDITNLATITKQDAIITAIENIPTTDVSNLATSNKQDSIITNQTDINNLVDALYELVDRLAFLPSVRWTTADLRVTPISLPTLWTVTTVSTLTNQTNIWGYIASMNVQSTVNMNTQSNYNNLIIS